MKKFTPKHGRRVVRVKPTCPTQARTPFLGSMKGLVEIVDPEDDLEAWDDEMGLAMEEKLDRLAHDLDELKTGDHGK